MPKINVINQDFEKIKDGLVHLIGKEINITIKDKTKVMIKKGVITIVSDNLFCIDVKIGKYHTCNFSHTFIDIATGKVIVQGLEL